MNSKSDKNAKIFQWISWAFLVISFIVLLCFLNARIDFLMSSDESSELILGNILAKENRIVTPNWFYSTELRVLNTQLIYALCFKLFSDWHMVRMVSTAIGYVLLLLCYYFLCRQLHCQKYFAISAVALLVPFSEEYFIVVLRGLYYIPHICISFLTIGLLFMFLHAKKIQKKILAICLAVLLAFLSCLGGVRQLVILFIPLVMLPLWEMLWILLKKQDLKKLPELINPDTYRLFVFSLSCLLSGILGYVINDTILSKYYDFISFSGISFTNFDMAKLGQIVAGLLRDYGFPKGLVFSKSLIPFVVCVLLIAFTVDGICYAIRNREKISYEYYIMVCFFIWNIVAFVGLYLFSDAPYADRYNIPIIIWSIPIGMLSMISGRWKSQMQSLLTTLLVIGLMLTGTVFLSEQMQNEENKELMQITSQLCEKGYTNGYATYWRGNLITELSDGQIDMWVWCDNHIEEVTDIHTVRKWLQKKEHTLIQPIGRQFILLTRDEYNRCNWQDWLLLEEAEYCSDSYVVFGFDR